MKTKKGPLWKSFYHAFHGIAETIVIERNMSIHFIIMLFVIFAGLFFHISKYEWFTCIILFGLIMALELVNTAVEATIDVCMPEIHPKAKIAKDTAAGSVLFAVIISVIIGLMIFIPKIINLFV